MLPARSRSRARRVIVPLTRFWASWVVKLPLAPGVAPGAELRKGLPAASMISTRAPVSGLDPTDPLSVGTRRLGWLSPGIPVALAVARARLGRAVGGAGSRV